MYIYSCSSRCFQPFARLSFFSRSSSLVLLSLPSLCDSLSALFYPVSLCSTCAAPLGRGYAADSGPCVNGGRTGQKESEREREAWLDWIGYRTAACHCVYRDLGASSQRQPLGRSVRCGRIRGFQAI